MNTSVVLPVMPSWEFPEVPYPSAGGTTARTRLPTFCPTSAVSRPGSMVPPITVGLLVKVLAFSVAVVPSQKYRTKFAAIASDLVTTVPVPGMTVLTVRALSALSFGMVTAGAVPKFPVTFTDALAFELAAAELELELALEFDEPQPAMTRQARSGTTMIARTRRMKEPQWWWTAAGVSLLALLTPGDDSVGPRGTTMLAPGGTTPLEPAVLAQGDDPLEPREPRPHCSPQYHPSRGRRPPRGRAMAITCRRLVSRLVRPPSGTGPCRARSAGPGRSASGAPSRR